MKILLDMNLTPVGLSIFSHPDLKCSIGHRLVLLMFAAATVD
jgi:hypothetical protein